MTSTKNQVLPAQNAQVKLRVLKSKIIILSVSTISTQLSMKLRVGQCATTTTTFQHVFAHVNINMWNGRGSAAR